MKQIRGCKHLEDKMNCLNLTYRCKDPNTGTQMTLEGVNNSAFDAAVLCSAVQDKLKQRHRRSTPRRPTGEDVVLLQPELNLILVFILVVGTRRRPGAGEEVRGGMFNRPRRVSAPPPDTESSRERDQNRRRSNMFGAPENETSRERDPDEEEV